MEQQVKLTELELSKHISQDKIAVIWSGGADSTYLLVKVLQMGLPVTVFSIENKSLPNLEEEQLARHKLKQKFNELRLSDNVRYETITINGPYQGGHVWAQAQMFSCAIQLYLSQYDAVLTGFVMGDQAMSFLPRFNEQIQAAKWNTIDNIMPTVYAPLRFMNKEAIHRELKKVDPDLTNYVLSCEKPKTDKHGLPWACESCPSCTDHTVKFGFWRHDLSAVGRADQYVGILKAYEWDADLQKIMVREPDEAIDESVEAEEVVAAPDEQEVAIAVEAEVEADEILPEKEVEWAYDWRGNITLLVESLMSVTNSTHVIPVKPADNSKLGGTLAGNSSPQYLHVPSKHMHVYDSIAKAYELREQTPLIQNSGLDHMLTNRQTREATLAEILKWVVQDGGNQVNGKELCIFDHKQNIALVDDDDITTIPRLAIDSTYYVLIIE